MPGGMPSWGLSAPLVASIISGSMPGLGPMNTAREAHATSSEARFVASFARPSRALRMLSRASD